MESTVDTDLLNMLHSHQQHRAAIYISVSVSCDTNSISIHFVLPATVGHTATRQYLTDIKQSDSSYGLSVMLEYGIAGKSL